jgi:hypothetical protein
MIAEVAHRPAARRLEPQHEHVYASEAHYATPQSAEPELDTAAASGETMGWYEVDPGVEIEVPTEALVADAEIEELKKVMELVHPEDEMRGSDDAERIPLITKT